MIASGRSLAAGHGCVTVGAGTAGCVLTARLSEDLAGPVQVMDAGTEPPGPFMRPSRPGPVADRGGASIAHAGARSVNRG